MGEQWEVIRHELELMRDELRSRYFNQFIYEKNNELDSDGKEKVLLYHIKEELQDVEHALYKMNAGTFGICEQTGDLLPIDKLQVLPTARTVYDFEYQNQYERKSLTYFHDSVYSHNLPVM